MSNSTMGATEMVPHHKESSREEDNVEPRVKERSEPAAHRPRVLIEPWLPTLELALAAIAGFLWYLQGGWVWYKGTWPGAWPLLLLGIMAALTFAREGLQALRPSAFTLPLLAFLASAGVSFWAAYDPELAIAKLWLIVAAIGLYWALAHQPDETRLTVALSFWALFAIVLTVYFLATSDWEAIPVKIPFLTQLGARISSRLPNLDVRHMNPNVTGGMLAVVLPLTVPLLTAGGRPIPNLPHTLRLLIALLGALSLSVGSLGLLVTVSRGAWIGIAGATVLWAAWRLLEPLGTRRAPVLAIIVLIGVLLTVTAGWAVAAGRLHDSLTTILRPPIANRLRLLSTSALLVHDTPFTGTGLGMYEMHFSIYALLIHVGYVEHSHNMLLDIAVEQGIFGAAALVVLVVSVCFQQPVSVLQDQKSSTQNPESSNQRPGARRCRLISESAFASLTALLLHSLVDDTIYGSRALLLLFVPFGILTATRRIQTTSRPSAFSARLRRLACAQTVLLLAVTGIGIWGTLGLQGGTLRTLPARWLAEWHANLGAVAQARVELNTYDPNRFGELTMDQVRRHEDLREAEARFERALRLNPRNATALHRLAAIALARDSYGEALAHMQALWDAGHRDRVTRLLYGDALIAAGRFDEAVDVVQGLLFARDRLLGQAWSRYHLDGDLTRETWARRAAAQIPD